MEALESRRRVLCLGAPRVDLVCERHVAGLHEAEAFVPRVGGTVANVAAVAASLGAPVTVSGGAGADAWAAWLRSRLGDAGVEVVPGSGAATPLAFVTVDGGGEPATVRSGADGCGLSGLDLRVHEAACLFLSSQTLAQAEDREVAMRARSVAVEHGIPVVLDPAVALADWRSSADAAASLNAVVPGALLVRVNAAEATLMTGEEDLERAALALVKAGARLVVITLGAEGAILRGELRADVDGVGVQVLSTLGAGDVFTGTLLGRLALSDFYPPVVAASMREAVAAASRACERWGALG